MLGMDAAGRLDVMQALDPRDNPFGLIVPLGDCSVPTLGHSQALHRRGASPLPPALQSPDNAGTQYLFDWSRDRRERRGMPRALTKFL